jgi:hypothetical protein
VCVHACPRAHMSMGREEEMGEFTTCGHNPDY